MSERLALPIGIDDFKKICTEGYYYVDKTLMIKELLDAKGMVNVFMRPRRFGKSLNLSMLKYFFEKTKEDTASLFRDMKIWKQGEKYTSQQGKFPVIHISLKATKTNSWEKMQKLFQTLIRNEYLKHEYLLSSPKLNNIDKETFKLTIDLKTNFDEALYINSLKNLSVYLWKHHGERAVLLIDEYDVPLQTSHINGFYKDAVNFVSGMFQESMKDTATSVEFAVITGCLRISKESIFTGFNNPNLVSILEEGYSEHFGFEESEVEDMLKYYNLHHKFQTTKDWYNGYKFGQTGIMNPWSILNYVNRLRINPDKIPESYWANTSGNDVVRKLIEALDHKSMSNAKADLETLMSGKTISKMLNVNVTYEDVGSNIDNIWNMLFFTGYLTQVSHQQVETKIYYDLKIPNLEVKDIFDSIISGWFNKILVEKNYQQLYEAMLKKDTTKMTDELSEVLFRSISSFDSKEAFYHGVLVGIFSTIPGYTLKSNRESGNGRSDITLIPANSENPVIIFELKVGKKFNEKKLKCQEALKQIEDMKYDYDLIEEGYENIIKYGIAFVKKECLVMCEEEI